MRQAASLRVVPSEHTVLDEEGASSLDDEADLGWSSEWLDAGDDVSDGEEDTGSRRTGVLLISDRVGYPGPASHFDTVLVPNCHEAAEGRGGPVSPAFGGMEQIYAELRGDAIEADAGTSSNGSTYAAGADAPPVGTPIVTGPEGSELRSTQRWNWRKSICKGTLLAIRRSKMTSQRPTRPSPRVLNEHGGGGSHGLLAQGSFASPASPAA